MTIHYWPWWLGGALLATVAILFPLLTGAPLGVSGALARLLKWGGDKPGDSATPSAPQCGGATLPETGSATASSDSASASSAAIGRGPDRLANLVFLLAVVVGGVIAGQVGGEHWGQTKLSPEFHRLFGHGLQALLVLFGGGILVGFGTRWSGGCTSGHGLSGCGRLQPASLIATGVFFGVAIGVSFLLERILS
ncbi:MAG: YeeE/YedE thiosulfate transporter family protein [Verrucomicrobiota bacterium]